MGLVSQDGALRGIQDVKSVPVSRALQKPFSLGFARGTFFEMKINCFTTTVLLWGFCVSCGCPYNALCCVFEITRLGVLVATAGPVDFVGLQWVGGLLEHYCWAPS